MATRRPVAASVRKPNSPGIFAGSFFSLGRGLALPLRRALGRLLQGSAPEVGAHGRGIPRSGGARSHRAGQRQTQRGSPVGRPTLGILDVQKLESTACTGAAGTEPLTARDR